MTLTPPATRGIKFSQIASGATHSLALGSDENLYAWGDNSSGQLGDGTNTLRRTPVKINKPANTSAQFTFTTIAAGDHSSLAIGSDGNLYAWGNNARGQLGDGTTENKLTPVKVPKPAGVSNGFTWTQVSTRWDHTLALGSDHNLYAWGWNNGGQLGDPNVPIGTDNSQAMRLTPSLAAFPLSPDVTAVKFDRTLGRDLKRAGTNWQVATPAHRKGQIKAAITWNLYGPQPDEILDYTYDPPIYVVTFDKADGSQPTSQSSRTRRLPDRIKTRPDRAFYSTAGSTAM